ncbi:hypothetical protein TIFTF001_023346 [Ficus carica]|uniref:Uncharacterized protein n=1 Tax=Ficus carica TaxID=3494 RepID=A0AA88ANB7_FICCA|nr:hypothetical protein TIFTF001_023346 [Ficus carica]
MLCAHNFIVHPLHEITKQIKKEKKKKKLFLIPLCSSEEAGKEVAAAVDIWPPPKKSRRLDLAISSSPKTSDPRGRGLLPKSEHRPSLPTPWSPSTSRSHLRPSRSPVGLWTKPAFSPYHKTPVTLTTCWSGSRAAPTLLAPRPHHTLVVVGNSLSSMPIAELSVMAANPNFKS